MPADRQTALAIVRAQRSGRPLLRHCAVHPAVEIRAEHVLAPLSHSRELARAPVSAVLSAEDYQLVQLEAPEVPAAELRSAVRWALRDLVNFPVQEAVIDVFEVPEHARYVESRMVFAVAARGEAVRRVVELVKPRARGFDVIDIPELCLRNLSTLLPQDEAGVALLALAEDFAQLVLTCQGILYLARRIDYGARSEALARRDTLSLREAADPELGIEPELLATELQRSLDYYESHFDRTPISELVVAAGDARGEKVKQALQSATGLSTSLLDIGELFDVAPGVEADTHFPGLIALGAALRREGSAP